MNFALFAPDCTHVKLLLYGKSAMLQRGATPVQTLSLFRTGHVFHGQARAMALPMAYSFQITTRKNETLIVRDPYGRLTAAGGAECYGEGTINR